MQENGEPEQSTARGALDRAEEMRRMAKLLEMIQDEPAEYSQTNHEGDETQFHDRQKETTAAAVSSSAGRQPGSEMVFVFFVSVLHLVSIYIKCPYVSCFY